MGERVKEVGIDMEQQAWKEKINEKITVKKRLQKIGIVINTQ